MGGNGTTFYPNAANTWNGVRAPEDGVNAFLMYQNMEHWATNQYNITRPGLFREMDQILGSGYSSARNLNRTTLAYCGILPSEVTLEDTGPFSIIAGYEMYLNTDLLNMIDDPLVIGGSRIQVAGNNCTSAMADVWSRKLKDSYAIALFNHSPNTASNIIASTTACGLPPGTCTMRTRLCPSWRMGT